MERKPIGSPSFRACAKFNQGQQHFFWTATLSPFILPVESPLAVNGLFLFRQADAADEVGETGIAAQGRQKRIGQRHE